MLVGVAEFRCTLLYFLFELLVGKLKLTISICKRLRYFLN